MKETCGLSISKIVSTFSKNVNDLKVIRHWRERTAEHTRIHAKVADRFNYVHYVDAVFGNDGDLVESIRCDCADSVKQGVLCKHGIALVVFVSGNPQDTLGGGYTWTVEEAIPEEPAVDTAEAYAPIVQWEESAPEVDAEIEIEAETEEAPLIDAACEENAEAPEEEQPAEPEPALKEEPSVCIEPRVMQILLGALKETEEPVYWLPNDTEQVFHTNMGIIGTMGTGKTQFTKSLVAQLVMQQANNFDGSPLGILIFDYKGDYNETKTDFVKATRAKVLKPYLIPYNPLALNSTNTFKPLLPIHTANSFKDTISKIYNLGPKQQQLLLECILAAYTRQGIRPEDPSTWRYDEPTFEQVYQIFEQETDGRTPDSLTAVMKKLHQFRIFEGVPSRARSLSSLLNGVVVMDLSGYDPDIQSLVVAITLDQFYAQMHAYGSSRSNGRYRQLRNFILVDEADNFMSQDFPSLKKIMKEGREFGVGMILSTQSLDHFVSGNDDYSRYVLTWVIHNVNDLSQRDIEYVLKLNSKSAEVTKVYNAVKNLVKHESIVKIANNAPITIRDKAFWQLLQENQ